MFLAVPNPTTNLFCDVTVKEKRSKSWRGLWHAISLCSEAGKLNNVGLLMFLMILNPITNMLWGDTVEGEEGACLGWGVQANFLLLVI